MLVSSHLGHFIFTIKLLPLLKATADLPGSDVRIVNVCLFKVDALRMSVLNKATR